MIRRTLNASPQVRPAAAAWPLAATFSAALWLVGCGVGVGGTGTGEDLEPFGASAASVCGAAFASALGCSTTGAAAQPDGTARRLFVDADSGGKVVVTFEGNRIELDARCAGQLFSGTWGVGQDAESRYFGSAARKDDASRQLAVLEVSLPAVANGADLLIGLNSSRGQSLVGLQRYRAVQALPSLLPACP